MAYKSVGAPWSIAVSGSTVLLATPTCAPGDILIAGFSVDQTSSSIAANVPGNWPRVSTKEQCLFDGQSFQWFARVAGASEPSTHQFNVTTGFNGGWAVMLCFSGRDTTLANIQTNFGFDASGTANPATVSAPGLTAPANADLVGLYFTDQNSDDPWVFAAPIGMTSRASGVGGDGGFASFGVATLDNVSAGATGNKDATFVFLGGTTGWGAFLLSIPAGAAPPDQLVEDAWDWGDEGAGSFDGTMEIEVTAQYQEPVAIAPPQPAQDVDDFTSDQAYEDPTTDLIESASGPVQANAPPGAPEDTWIWQLWDDANSEDLLTLDTLPVGPDAPPAIPDDAWPWPLFDDPTGDALLEFDLPPVGADAPAPATFQDQEQPQTDEVDDELWWTDGAFLSDNALTIADQPPSDEWVWDDLITDELADESAPVAIDDGLLDDAWPFDDVADDDAWWAEWPTLQVDQAASVDIVLQDEPDLAQDADHDLIDESSPVGADLVLVDQPPGDQWADDDLTDELLEDSAPVGADAPPLPLPDGWNWESDHVDDDSWWLELPVQLVDFTPQIDVVLQDEPDFAEDVGDELIEPFALVGPDEPPLAAPDAWNWDEEPADDDTWWQLIDFPLVDFVQLPGPTYAEAWDFNADDTDDDAQWLEITQPDAGALPVDTCPAQLAAAMARIAELEALLAAALAAAGTGGGGASGNGDDIDHDAEQRHILQLSADRKRARIAQNNAFIMSLAAATVRGLKGPK